MGIPIRRSRDRVIFYMGIPIPVKRHLYILDSMVSHSRVIVGLSQSAPAVGWGSPFHAWLASVNWIGCAGYLNWIEAIAMGPVARITTYYCGRKAKTITLTIVWWKILIVHATKMHVSKFQLGIPNGCCVTKAQVKHALVARRHAFTESVG